MIRFSKTQSVISKQHLDRFIVLAWPRFIETKSGYILIIEEWGKTAGEIEKQKRYRYHELSRPRFFDNTDYESSLNHVHLEDALEIKSSKHLTKICRKIGEMWAVKLKHDFPQRRFRIYLHDTTLRFHQIHEEEPPWLEEKDFEKEVRKGKLIIWEI